MKRKKKSGKVSYTDFAAKTIILITAIIELIKAVIERGK